VLLANGSDITATDKDGRSPLHKACERGCLAVGVMLLENKADVDALDLVRACRDSCPATHPTETDAHLTPPDGPHAAARRVRARPG
jgi:ankyrin repeat protein